MLGFHGQSKSAVPSAPYARPLSASIAATSATPPLRQASHAIATIAAPWSSAPPTSVAHAGRPVSPDNGASNQNIAGPGWFQPNRL